MLLIDLFNKSIMRRLTYFAILNGFENKVPEILLLTERPLFL